MKQVSEAARRSIPHRRTLPDLRSPGAALVGIPIVMWKRLETFELRSAAHSGPFIKRLFRVAVQQTAALAGRPPLTGNRLPLSIIAFQSGIGVVLEQFRSEFHAMTRPIRRSHHSFFRIIRLDPEMVVPAHISNHDGFSIDAVI